MTFYVERDYRTASPVVPNSIKHIFKGGCAMIYVGIDVAKSKHDCCITDSDGEILAGPFTITNNKEGFLDLLGRIKAAGGKTPDVKAGLESTGHYSYNILGFLTDNNVPTFLINPMHTNLYRKSLSLRQTKTDKVDSRTIAMMLMSGMDLQSYSAVSYHNEELKSLTRYRFDKVQERAKLKASVSRLVVILFPELEALVPSLHESTVYQLLADYPGASFIADVHLTRLSNLVETASHGHYDKAKAIEIRNAARNSIGSVMPAKSLELRHTIHLIREFDSEIADIEERVKSIMDAIDSPILTIPGINYRMGAMILAEIGDFNRFSSPDKILAYAGMSPTVYQSGAYESTHAHMEKRGSKYLRYALFNAAKYVCLWDPEFKAYLTKKRAEGKHYNVAVCHAAKKLIRLIYALEKTGQPYTKVR